MSTSAMSNPPVAPEAQPDILHFPCSSSQQRCWFIDALDPGSAALNVALRWELTGLINETLIERAFNVIVERHEVLRTRFIEVDGEPMQEVVPRLRLKLSNIDLRHLPEELRDGEARKLAEREAHTPFDIHELPLIRVTLLRLAADRANLLLTVHQIAFDGWSIRIVAAEFGEIAAAYEQGRSSPLPELPLQYGDYARWQTEYLASQAKRYERYWYDQLIHAPYFEVPGDFEKPARPTHRGNILAEMLSPEMGERMEETARRLGVTSFALGCAATVALLKRLTGHTDIILGTQVAGRDETDLEPLIGVFINNLVLRVDTRHAHTFDTLLARTNETVSEALIHQRMPFHRLVELINPPRDPARTPLISINFTMLKEVLDHKQYGGLFLHGLPSVSAGSLYDLNFFVVKWPDGWRMAMEYNPDIFRDDTARAFIKLWRQALESAVADPAFPLDSLEPPARTAPVPTSPRRALSAAALPVAGARLGPMPDPATELALADIWRDVLGAEEVTADSHFFELGGHSLLAVRMLARVHARFGRRIDPLTLFEAPTLRQLALRLSDAQEAVPAWSLVPIQPQGTGTPVIAINNTLAYYNVARAIGADRPFIGVQLFDPNAPRELEDRPLEDIARDYVKLIRRARPRGPYVLIGLCVAGAIAYEAARQLEEDGEDVPLVVLADLWLPGYLANLPKRRKARFRQAYRWHVIKHHRMQLATGNTTLPDVLATYSIVRKTRLLEAAAGLGLIENRPYNQDDWGNRWFVPALQRAREVYRARPFRGRVVLLRSDEMILAGLGEDMGWTTVLPKPPSSYAIPGWHADMFQDEGARVIAEKLRPFLEEVDAEAKAAEPSAAT
ncbi:condensation domain-containing protein [Chelatococcus reniformis]|uniref:Carrier domain-containing protein n=1 Tax=Chelatococcus reniformis TaxID=1494448 RepID=A0A916UGW7_9HYPH|nr:condensation domain-containing protein [Chelatococcus reniformis]GGC72209.1 hypothetical protein GCM10010994_33260 [Chelatococcus reniformis]